MLTKTITRNPKIDPQWLKDCKTKGANIKVLPNDISSAEGVEKVYKTGPEETLGNFAAHLRFKGHRAAVAALLSGTPAPVA